MYTIVHTLVQAYPDPVRVVSVGKSVDDLLADPDNKENYQFSVEFCGGTHMKNTSEAKNFAVVGETAQAQGACMLSRNLCGLGCVLLNQMTGMACCHYGALSHDTYHCIS